MKKLFYIVLLLFTAQVSLAQDRTVQNRPYTDLRPFHFGVLVGTHVQDLELMNVGTQMLDIGDGNGVREQLVSVDQDRWDAGFVVGVLGELRLNTTFQLRIAPAMYFGTRHLTFRDQLASAREGKAVEKVQDLKTAYISCAFDLITAAPRFNNHRPYLMLGINPMLNLSGKETDYLKLNRSDVYLELGVGCDFYLPFFKLRPELKFMYGLSDCLDVKHAKKLKDKRMLMYTGAAGKGYSKKIALVFYFE